MGKQDVGESLEPRELVSLPTLSSLQFGKRMLRAYKTGQIPKGYIEFVYGSPADHQSTIERCFQTGEMKELTKSFPLLRVTLKGIELSVAAEVITLAKEAKSKRGE